MNNGDKPIANPYVLLREEFDDWAVLYDPDTGRGFGLNPTSVYVWKLLLDGEHDLGMLLEEIHRHAESVPEDVGDHVVAFIDTLIAEGLAGLDQGRYWAENSSFPPAATVSEVQRLTTYEPPKLINLNSEQTAYGATCGTGSHATNACTGGNAACTTCSGGTSGGPCCSGYGSCASYSSSCCGGACNDACGCGTCVGYCTTGSSGGNWCFGGDPQCTAGCNVQMVNCATGH